MGTSGGCGPIHSPGVRGAMVPLIPMLKTCASLGRSHMVDATNAAIEKTAGHQDFTGELS